MGGVTDNLFCSCPVMKGDLKLNLSEITGIWSIGGVIDEPDTADGRDSENDKFRFSLFILLVFMILFILLSKLLLLVDASLELLCVVVGKVPVIPVASPLEGTSLVTFGLKAEF